MDYKQIVFLSSYPKSGNTWVRCFLEAYILGDVDINDLVISVPDDHASRSLVGDGSDPTLYPIDIQMLTRPMALLRMVRKYHEVGIPGVPLFVKTHNAHLLVNGIELLPHSLTKAVVYLIRDPRDVVVSFSKHMGCDIDKGIDWFTDKYRVLENAEALKMSDYISSWSKHASSYCNADSHNVLVVRYEDLKLNPVESFSKILEHSGITPDIERVKQAIETVKIDRLRQQEEQDGFRESSPHAKDKFFGQAKTGGWKDKLTLPQAHKIEKACKSIINRYYRESYGNSSRLG